MKNNILDKIRDYKINEVKERKINFPQNDIIDLIQDDKRDAWRHAVNHLDWM